MMVDIAIAPDQRRKILLDAIEKRLHVTVSRQLDNGWQTFPGFLEKGKGESDLLWIKLLSAGSVRSFWPPQQGETVGISFRRGNKKCLCSAQINQIDGPDCDSLGISWPGSLQILQRRIFQRVTILPEFAADGIQVRYWPYAGTPQPSISSNAIPADRLYHQRTVSDQEMLMLDEKPAKVFTGQLQDISVGGARVCTTDYASVQIGATYQLQLLLHSSPQSLQLDAILRHKEAPNQGCSSLGFQFVGLETGPDSPALMLQLARLVVALRRQAHPQ